MKWKQRDYLGNQLFLKHLKTTHNQSKPLASFFQFGSLSLDVFDDHDCEICKGVNVKLKI